MARDVTSADRHRGSLSAAGVVNPCCTRNVQEGKGGGQAQPTARIVGIFLGKLGFAKQG